MSKKEENKSGNGFCITRSINRYRIIDYPIDLIGIILALVAFGISVYLAVKYAGDPVQERITPDCIQNIVFDLVGIGVYIGFILGNRILLRKNKCVQNIYGFPFPIPVISANPNQFSWYDDHIRKKNLPLNPKTKKELFYTIDRYALYIFGCLGTFGIIEFVVQKLLGQAVFQVVVIDVYAFFISGAICEEMFFRAFLTTIFQLIYGLAVIGSMAKNKQRITKTRIMIVNILASLTTGFMFFIAHQRYFTDISASVITILIGFSQGMWFLYSKSLLAVMVAHALGNAVSAGRFLQYLGS